MIGIVFVTSYNPISSYLVKKYETVKGSYEPDKEYLAAINKNGILVKGKSFGKSNLKRTVKVEN